MSPSLITLNQFVWDKIKVMGASIQNLNPLKQTNCNNTNTFFVITCIIFLTQGDKVTLGTA